MNSSSPDRVMEEGAALRDKRLMQGATRTFHHLLFRRGAPARLALYLHELLPATAAFLEESIRYFRGFVALSDE